MTPPLSLPKTYVKATELVSKTPEYTQGNTSQDSTAVLPSGGANGAENANKASSNPNNAHSDIRRQGFGPQNTGAASTKGVSGEAKDADNGTGDRMTDDGNEHAMSRRSLWEAVGFRDMNGSSTTNAPVAAGGR